MRRILAVCLVLVMASVGFASEGNWEGTSMDGWAAQGTTVAIPGMTTGVTLDSGSLGVAVGDGWQVILKKEYGFWWQETPFTNPTIFTIDVTMIASEWVISGVDPEWGVKPLESLVMAGPGSGWWRQLSPVAYPDFSGDGTRLGIWLPEDGDVTVTYTFMIPGEGYQVYESLNLITNSGVCQQRGIIYLDNAQLPEPATMALMGLGGLALIRRKK